MSDTCKKCGGSLYPAPSGDMVCSFCGAVFPKSAPASAPAPAAKNTAMNNVAVEDAGTYVYESSIGGILEIYVNGRSGSWSGSGYLITRDGYAITNAHVAAEKDGSPCSDIVVRLNGRNIRAYVIALADDRAGSGSGDDLALLRLESMPSDAKALPLGDSGSVRNGETVFAIGNSLGYGTCIVRGIISDSHRDLCGKTMIMTDCATNPGNSGGPLFNRAGQVVGTIVAHAVFDNGRDAAGMRYAIPTSTALGFVRRYVRI